MTVQLSPQGELTPILAQKLEALMLEMQSAGWETASVAAAMRDILNKRWLAEADRLEAARHATPDNFVSDGNEG